MLECHVEDAHDKTETNRRLPNCSRTFPHLLRAVARGSGANGLGLGALDRDDNAHTLSSQERQ